MFELNYLRLVEWYNIRVFFFLLAMSNVINISITSILQQI